MSTVLSGGDDLYEKENGGPVFQQPTTSAHQLIQRLDAFLTTIPGCNPKVGMTNEDIDKFFIVFGPTKDLLEYALNNRPSEEDKKELEDLCKETHFLCRIQLQAYLDFEKELGRDTSCCCIP
jgi:hypothetical protein